MNVEKKNRGKRYGIQLQTVQNFQLKICNVENYCTPKPTVPLQYAADAALSTCFSNVLNIRHKTKH